MRWLGPGVVEEVDVVGGALPVVGLGLWLWVWWLGAGRGMGWSVGVGSRQVEVVVWVGKEGEERVVVLEECGVVVVVGVWLGG